MLNANRAELRRKLLYEFENVNLLEEALRHSSFVNEQAEIGMRDNERLEFLGDAVLNLVVGDMLMQHYPDSEEGDLSRMRANLVNETQLAAIARSLNLGSYLQLGKGEIQTNGREKSSILADTLEAVMAAIYLDGGFEAAFNVIDRHFAPLIDVSATPMVNFDYKSQVQEFVQVTQQEMPIYTVIHESGPDHDKTFQVQLQLQQLHAEGVGKSKKLAEQDAARKALELLKSNT
jgi:ribonuclease III